MHVLLLLLAVVYALVWSPQRVAPWGAGGKAVDGVPDVLDSLSLIRTRPRKLLLASQAIGNAERWHLLDLHQTQTR